MQAHSLFSSQGFYNSPVVRRPNLGLHKVAKLGIARGILRHKVLEGLFELKEILFLSNLDSTILSAEGIE